MHIAAGRFKAECLHLMDRVHDTHEKVVITKRGRPVAQMVPVEEPRPVPLFARLAGLLQIHGDVIGPVSRGTDGGS